MAVHLALGVLVIRALSFGHGFSDFFGLRDFGTTRQEQLTFIETVPELVEEPEAEVEPSVAPTPPQPQVQAPAPSRGPVLAPPGAPAPGPITTGADTSSGAPNIAVEPVLVGVRPGGDPRVWSAPNLAALRALRERGSGGAGLLGAAELDSVIAFTLFAARDSLDSLAVLNAIPGPVNWTKKDGKGGTWGMDENGNIRLGKVTIPGALLAALPAGLQRNMAGLTSAGGSGNVGGFTDRSRRQSFAEADIRRFRDMGVGDDQFKALVDELRERKERERNARRAQQRAADRVAEQGGDRNDRGNRSGNRVPDSERR